jgi:hypothetical protein
MKNALFCGSCSPARIKSLCEVARAFDAYLNSPDDDDIYLMVRFDEVKQALKRLEGNLR